MCVIEEKEEYFIVHSYVNCVTRGEEGEAPLSSLCVCDSNGNLSCLCLWLDEHVWIGLPCDLMIINLRGNWQAAVGAGPGGDRDGEGAVGPHQLPHPADPPRHAAVAHHQVQLLVD